MVLTLQPAKPASLLAPQLGFQSPTAAGAEASGLLLREVTTISNFTHKWWSPWKSNAEYGTAREKGRLFSPFEGLINADINPQLQDKD